MAPFPLQHPGNYYCTAYGGAPNTTSILMIFLVIISITALIILSFITYHSSIELSKLKKLRPSIKYLFITSIIMCYFLFIIALTRSIVCIGWNVYLPVIYMDAEFMLLYCTLFQILLAIYILRLHYTFNDSAFALTKLQMSIMGSLYIIITILMALYVFDYMVVTFHYQGDWKRADRYFLEGILGYMGPIALVLYVIVSIYVLYLFVDKLLKLVKMGSFEAELSPSQRNMIHSASKYASIFSLAIITSIITVIGWNVSTLLWDNNTNWNQGNSFLQQIMLVSSTIDAIVNITCQYLQFSFTAKYYNKYCRKCMGMECCCKRILTYDVKKSNQCVEFTTISADGTSDED
eukprot:231717_1